MKQRKQVGYKTPAGDAGAFKQKIMIKNESERR
jgi:hypothetical protein